MENQGQNTPGLEKLFARLSFGHSVILRLNASHP